MASWAHGEGRCEIGSPLLVEADHGEQTIGGGCTLLVHVERFDHEGVWVRRLFDQRVERLVAPFKVLSKKENPEPLIDGIGK